MNFDAVHGQGALGAAFAAHADEALAVANETFDAAAESWLRECVWPDCLTDEQSAHLVAEIAHEEMYGVPYPDRDLTDRRAVCGCTESNAVRERW